MKITKDMTIGEVINKKPDAVGTLMGFGLGCVGCPSAQGETLEEASELHGININEILNKLNAEQ